MFERLKGNTQMQLFIPYFCVFTAFIVKNRFFILHLFLIFTSINALFFTIENKMSLSHSIAQVLLFIYSVKKKTFLSQNILKNFIRT